MPGTLFTTCCRYLYACILANILMAVAAHAQQASPPDTISYRVSKDSLDAPVNYKAKDSIVLVVPSKQFYLYGNANTKYKTTAISALRPSGRLA